MLKQEEQGTAAALRATTGTTDSVNVVIGVIRWVILNDPIDLREVKTTLCHIRAEQNTFFGLAELKVG